MVWSDAGVTAPVRESFDQAAATLPARVREMDGFQHEDERCLLRLWSASHARPEHVQRIDRPPAMLAFVGNPTLARESAASWPSLLTESLDRGAPALETVWPPFCAFLRDLAADTLTIAVDRSALQHLYIRQGPDGTVWASTSAFALASLGVEFDLEAATEWATAGHFITGRTFFREVRELDCGEVIHLRPGAPTTRTTWLPTPRAETTPTEYRERIEEAVAAYSQQEEGLFFELTGGIDSRLLLAARFRSGTPTQTWTVGQPDDVEMRTIERLKGAASFEHLLVSPDTGLAAELPKLIDEMHALADGEANAVVYTSLLVAFRELAGIRRTSVTGSNGELARAFYWRAIARGRQASHVRGVVIDTLARRIFRESGGVRALFRPDLPDPEGPVREAATDFVRGSLLQTPSAILDDFYLRTRMRRFAGRNISTTSLFCAQGVPYFAHPVVDVILALPPAQKQDGRVVRETIVELSPRLAAVPLASGETVAPLSFAHPSRGARRGMGLGLKAMARYGGRYGRMLARAPVDSMPFRQVAEDPGFRDYVGDLLLTGDTRSLCLFDREALRTFVESSLASGSLSPLGIVLTIELTLRRFNLTV
jgi:hypothetical protein